MQRRARYSSTTTIVLFLGLAAATASAQPAQNQPAQNPAPPFCPAAADKAAPADAAMPNVNAGMAAFRNKNYRVAYSHLHPLADSGNVEAQRGLGLMLMQSCGPDGDHSVAVANLEKAATASDVPASAALGRMYMDGNGVTQDDSIAFKWITQAANGGDLPSQVSLGVLYADGRGVVMDLYKAIVLWVHAGEQGAPFALSNIGRAYSTGKVLPKDNFQALFYLMTAMQRMNQAQRNQIANLVNSTARQMSVDDVRRIGMDAQKWSPGPGSLDKVLVDAAKQRDGGGTSEQGNPTGQPARPAPTNAPADKSKRSA